MNKKLLTFSAVFLINMLFFGILPTSSFGYYEISNSKVTGETRFSTFSHILKPQTEAVLKLSNIPGWYPADNTNPQVVEMDFVSKDLVVFTAQSQGISASRVCNDYTTECITVLITVTDDEKYIANKPTLKNGQLALDGTTVYIIYKNTKTAFTNYPAFTGLGFKLSQISFKGNLSQIPNSGYLIENANDWHPWGSLVKQGKQVYLVSELGLMPIPSMDVLKNNGGEVSMIVAMNQADTKLSRTTMLMFSDYRLK